MNDENANDVKVWDDRRFPTGEKLERVVRLSRGRDARHKLMLPELRANENDCLNRFLYVLSRTGRVVDAMNVINADERSLYLCREQDQEFADCWRQAQDLYTAALEDEVQRRAVEGVEVAIFYKGVPVGIERRYSDTLLIALLKRRSAEWRAALTGPGTDVNVSVSQALQNAPGAAIDAPPDADAMRRRLAALSPEERAVALRLFAPELAQELLPSPATGKSEDAIQAPILDVEPTSDP